MSSLKETLRSLLPTPLVSLYHLLLAYLGAWRYGFPSRRLILIGVTGTKGKSSTTEMVNAVLEEAGYKTAVLNSIRIKVAERSEANLMRMSMPGRAFIQKFLRGAVNAGCTAAILEMTSQGAAQNRHRALELDAFIFTNLAPEHIESHGSYEAYADAKLELAKQLVRSKKRPRIMVVNGDDEQSARYLALGVEKKVAYSLSGNEPYGAGEHGGYLTFSGLRVPVSLPGEFSLKNALAAAEVSRAMGVAPETIARGIKKVTHIPGRAERIESGQDFTVIVDYAHTPDSLEAIYRAYPGEKIAVLGSMGGSRDTWNRPVKARIAAEHCRRVILTNEDPCDDDPKKIVEEMARGVPKGARAEIIIDRREAIRSAIAGAKSGETVLITGKGTDPWIYGPGGTKIPWSDAGVAREELQKRLAHTV